MNTTTFASQVREIASVKEEGSDEDWTTAKILNEASQALVERFWPTLLNLRSGYGLHRSTQATERDRSSYQIPPRAIAGGLEKLEISTDSGASFRQLPILTDSQATDYFSTSPGEPRAFSLEADRVVLYPTPSSGTWTLKMSYYLRPSALVTTVANGIVTATATVGGTPTLSVATMPSGLGASGTLDCIHTVGSYELSLVGITYTSAFGEVVLPVGTDISRVSVGDVIRVVETSDYIPLPVELHRPLADYTAAVILAARGDFEKAKIWSGKADTAIARFVDVASPRIKTKPYVFKTRNTFLRRRIGSRGI